MKKTLFVSASGGRTSMMMCKWLLDNTSHIYNFIFTFANTGKEHPATLDFVNECDIRWGLNVVWLEAVAHKEENKGSTHKIVDYKTASRNGEPFLDMVKVYGIPNQDYPHCNRELKINAIKSYKRSIGFKANHVRALGYRVDEIQRANWSELEAGEVIYPFIKWNPVTKAEVRHWWKEQDFDLAIDEHYGNCTTCWKKSLRKLMTIAKHTPEEFDLFKGMEKNHSKCGADRYNEAGELEERVFFRGYKSSNDIINDSKKGFVEFVDSLPELQLRLDLPVDKIDFLDIQDSCGETSCEA